MSLTSRRSAPALLQVGAIVGRLRGEAALAEVRRYLRAEFGHLDTLELYRNSEGRPVPVRSEAAPGDPAPDVALAESALRRGSTVGPGPNGPGSAVAVPVTDGGSIVGVIVVVGSTPGSLDDSDRRFLEELARRIAPVFTEPTVPKPL